MTSFTYEGDIDTVNQWLPFARSKQASIKRIGVDTLNLTPVDDVLIMIRNNPDHIHIVASGGLYYFLSDTGNDGIYLAYRGAPPKGVEEQAEGDTPSLISSTVAKVHKGKSYLSKNDAPRADRHSWYGLSGKKKVTVLSGFGVRYGTNLYPFDEFNRQSDVYSSFLNVFIGGKLFYTTDWAAFNGLVLDGLVIGFHQNDGAITYTDMDDLTREKREITINGLDHPMITTADFREDLPAETDPTAPFDVRKNRHELNSITERIGFESFSLHWSFSQDGSKATGVALFYYDLEYHAYVAISHSGLNVDDRDPAGDYTTLEVIPVLVEVSLEVVSTVDNEGVGTKELVVTATNIDAMGYYNTGGYLIAADYYYYPPKEEGLRQPYEPVENELIMCFVEYHDYENYTIGENGANVTVVIKNSVGTEYIRDMINYNVDITTVETDPSNPLYYFGELQALDLRSCAYVINTPYTSNTGFSSGKDNLRVVFRGKEIFKQGVHINAPVSNDILKPYDDVLSSPDSGANRWAGFWNYTSLNGYMMANPFNDSLFVVLQLSPSVYSAIWDIYFKFNKETGDYDATYQYHTKSEGSQSPLLSRHAASGVWII